MIAGFLLVLTAWKLAAALSSLALDSLGGVCNRGRVWLLVAQLGFGIFT